jgi:tetratricopeptide (TPR) repeat protein
MARRARFMHAAGLGALLGAAPLALAGEIELKNGRVLEGDVVASDGRTVTIDIPEVGALTISRAEIRAIDGHPLSETEPVPVTRANSSDAARNAQADDRWETFQNRKRGVKIAYPRGWHVLETADRFPYMVTIEPTPPSPDLAAATPTVIELFKYYHLATMTTFGRGDPAEVLERYVSDVLPTSGPGATVMQQRPASVQGVPARLVELRASDPRNQVPLRLMVLAAVKRDVLVSLFCQAPEAEFEQHRAMCDEVVRRVRPFSSDAAQSDNEQLDAETNELMQQAHRAFQAGDMRTAVGACERALRINPGEPLVHMNYGSLLLEAGKREPAGKGQDAVLGRAWQELDAANRLFGIVGSAKDAPVRSQILFLLGQIAQHARKNPKAAREYYEEALKLFDHGGAKQALDTLPAR